jgi:hypothetical protein
VPALALLRKLVSLTACAGFLAAIGIFLAIQSLLYGLGEIRPIPLADHWGFLGELRRWSDGRFTLSNLFQQHNEHRIVTSRLGFFLDAHAFNMSNVSLVATMYATLLGLAAAIVRLTFGPQGGWKAWGLAFPVCLGILWSPVQYGNLSWAFQPQFPYVHLFAALTIWAFARLNKSESAQDFLRAAALLALADFLAVYSMVSGLFVIGPVIAVALWLRSRPRVWMTFLAIHSTLMVAYFSGYSTALGHAMSVAPAKVLAYTLRYLGKGFDSTETVALAAGGIGMIVLLALSAGLLVQSLRKRPADPAIAVLLGCAGFVVMEAVVTAVGRAEIAVGPAYIAIRYVTPSLMFWLALLGAVWRYLMMPGLGAAAGARIRVGLAATAAWLLWATNYLGDPYTIWALTNRDIDTAVFALVSGVESDTALKTLYPDPSAIRPAVQFMRTRQLGPFSPDDTRYALPIHSFQGLRRDRLQPCAGLIESMTSGDSSTRLSGWVGVKGSAARHAPADWVAAYDPAGRMVGYTRPSILRPDARFALKGTGRTYGFDFHVGAPQAAGLLLVAMGSQGSGFCTLRPQTVS